MTFEIEINGRTQAVSIEPAAGTGTFHVTVDGRARVVDATRIGDYGLSLLVNGKEAMSREVSVVPDGGRGELLIAMDGRSVPASVNARRTRRPIADAGGHGDGDQPVVAPMPGRVVRVLVAVGDEVAARQGVIVVEAMKMENELRSPKAGRIKEVSVTPGMSVESGRVLVVVE